MVDVELVTPEEAAALLSKRAGYQITSEDLKQLRRHGRVKAAKQLARMTFYERSEIEKAPLPKKRHPLPLTDFAQKAKINELEASFRNNSDIVCNQDATSLYPLPFDHQLCANAAFEDLNLWSIHDFLGKSRVQSQSNFAHTMSIQDQLVQLGLMRKLYTATSSGEQVIPTYGTLLCFGLQPSIFLPGAITHCTYWRGVDRHSGWFDDEEYRGNLLEQLQSSINFLVKHLQISSTYSKDNQKDSLEFPTTILHEAIVNALVHREYANRTDFVHIELFDDRIEISNPGGPPPPMRMDLLGIENRSFLRNHQIARIFYLIGNVQKVGSGISHMQYSMQKSGLSKLSFMLSETETFKAVLYRMEKSAKLSD
jgi:predicted HTH transcriptional regulator